MPIVAEAKGGKNFELPKEGTVQAVLAEVRDLGLVDTTFNGKTKKTHKVLFRWQLAELDSEGQPKRAYERFTLSLHEKAALRKRVAQMFGKEPPTTLDLEKIVGTNVNLVIVHAPNAKDASKPWVNIAAVLRLAPGAKKLDIVALPKKEELAAEIKASEAEVAENTAISDDDIPF